MSRVDPGHHPHFVPARFTARRSGGRTLELGRYCRRQPILARRPSMVGRTRRWCAKNRALSASLAATALVLVCGVVGITWEAVRAKAEAARSYQVARFLQEMLKGVGPSVAKGRDTTLLKEIPDQTAERIGRELKGQPVVEAELRATIAMDNVGIVLYRLGKPAQAETQERRVLAMRIKTLGPNHPKWPCRFLATPACRTSRPRYTLKFPMERSASWSKPW